MKKICKNCGQVATPVTIKPGSVGLEIGLWLLGIVTIFLLPAALLYTIWRRWTAVSNCCPMCKQSNTMIPVDTVIGQKLLKELEPVHAELLSNGKTISSISRQYTPTTPTTISKTSIIRNIAIGIIILFGLTYLQVVSEKIDVKQNKADQKEQQVLSEGKIHKSSTQQSVLAGMLNNATKSKRKYPALNTLQNWEAKNQLSSWIDCKEEFLLYTLNNDNITLTHSSCSKKRKTVEFYMNEQRRDMNRKNSKEILKTGLAEVVIGKPERENGKISIITFIYGLEDYVGLWCTGSAGVEKICRNVAIEVANQIELF